MKNIRCSVLPLLLCLLAFAAHAENLVSLQTRDIAALPSSTHVERLVVIDGKPVAIGNGGAWVLADDRKSWGPLQVSGSQIIVAAAGDGQRLFTLRSWLEGDHAISGLAISADGRALVKTDSLPLFPAALADVQMALAKDMLYITGLTENGESKMYTLDLAAAPVAWVTYAGPPVTGKITSLTGQTNALSLPQQTARASRTVCGAGRQTVDGRKKAPCLER